MLANCNVGPLSLVWNVTAKVAGPSPLVTKHRSIKALLLLSVKEYQEDGCLLYAPVLPSLHFKALDSTYKCVTSSMK